MTVDMSRIEIGGLAALDLPTLRKRWRELYRSDAPVRMSRELLIQAIAFRVQEDAHGGLSRASRMKLAAALNGTGMGRKSASGKTLHWIKPGTRFLREWQGQTYEVTATANGRFLYRGASYRSLSEIARQITGTRWSGPAFFGLKQSSVAAHAPK